LRFPQESWKGRMKHTSEVIIDLPRQRVIELLGDRDNLSRWQTGLRSYELLSGEEGQVGAKARLVRDIMGRRIEMIETVISLDLPDAFTSTYETKGVLNRVENRFYEISPEKTRWVMESELTTSGGMAMLGGMIRGVIEKQTVEQMRRFRAFAESA
jgi:uncharacterized membrane protein